MRADLVAKLTRLPMGLLLALGGFLAACGPEGGGAPGQAARGSATEIAQPLVCAEPSHDFGLVWEGALLAHEFELEMRSEAPGSVVLVKADCGCTVTELEVELRPGAGRVPYELKTPLTQGARLFVRVTYDTRDKHGPAPRSITVFGPSGALRLGLEVDVQPWLSISPELAKVGVLEESKSTSTSFEIQSLAGEPFALAYERSAVPEELSVVLIPEGALEQGRAQRWQARVTLDPGMPLGLHTYPIRLTSDVPIEGSALAEPESRPPTHAVSSLLMVTVVGAVSITPAALTFGVVQPGETVARRLRLVCHDAAFALPEPSVRFEPLEGDLEFALGKTAQVTQQPVPGESAWDIQLLFRGLDPAVQDNFFGRLVIQTGHPEQSELVALVRGVRMPMGSLKRQ